MSLLFFVFSFENGSRIFVVENKQNEDFDDVCVVVAQNMARSPSSLSLLLLTLMSMICVVDGSVLYSATFQVCTCPFCFVRVWWLIVRRVDWRRAVVGQSKRLELVRELFVNKR